MENPIWIGLATGCAIGYVIGWYQVRRQFWRSGHWSGQVAMKEQIRREVNENITAKNLSVHFRDGREISAEQMLQFMCYGNEPDPNDASRGVATYKPT